MTEPTIAYCVKCKEKREMTAPEAVYTVSATPGTRGTCSVCGTNMFKMGATPAHEGLPKPEPKPRTKTTKAKSKAKAGAKKGKGKKSGTTTRAKSRRGKLVIVESPAKARTIGKFLGRGYTVKASVGHIRDLLRSQLSVDVENDFAPKYRVPNEKRSLVKELTKDAASASEIYLATDADREGEAIAWHLMEAAEMEPERVKRVVFHEITKDAIAHAFAEPRDVNIDRVNAQQTRRILDRLVGYKISPLLWRRVRSRTSAGRVQSVALRQICEREEAIAEFVPVEYWSIKARLSKQDKSLKPKNAQFVAKLLRVKGKPIDLKNKAESQQAVEALKTLPYTIADVKRGQRRRRPSAPFITSTLQQDASRRLSFGTRKTMRMAQQLYEGVELAGGQAVGLITYMRTDSTHIAAQAQTDTRRFITEKYGADLLPKSPPEYKTRAGRAQEAHEAIRPTDVSRTPSELKGVLSRDQYRLYDLIWKRFVASQMKDALYETMRVDITAGDYLFRASGSRLQFAGFLTVYEESVDEDAQTDDDANVILPELEKDESLDLLELLPAQHFTQPPPRYTEASLIKELEEFGIGRPSTYAPTISTIQDRGYVERVERRLHPTDLGNTVNELVVEYFPGIINVDFTAHMEEDLDKIAWGEENWVSVLDEFYQPFESALQTAEANMPKVEVANATIGEKCEKCGHDLIIRYGRFGKFIACSNFPECRYTRPFTEKIGVNCPDCDGELVARKTKKGRIFYGCDKYPECEWTSWKRPLATPCPNCDGMLVAQSRKTAQCLACHERVPLESLPEQTTAPAAEPEKSPQVA